MAGSMHGSRKSVEELEALAAAAGRPSRQRTTTYGDVSPERLAASRRRHLDLDVVTATTTAPAHH
jgi:FO synthase